MEVGGFKWEGPRVSPVVRVLITEACEDRRFLLKEICLFDMSPKPSLLSPQQSR